MEVMVMEKITYEAISDVINRKSGDFRVYGKAVFTAEPEQKTSDRGTFYTQKVYLKDESCDTKEVLKPSVIIGHDKSAEIVKGMMVDVVGNINQKGGRVYFNGKLVAGNEGEKESVQVTEEVEKEKVEKKMAILNSGNGNGNKDNYWEKKFDWEINNEKKKQGSIARSVAINGAVLLLANKAIKKDEFWGWVHDMAGYSLKGQYPIDADKDDEVEYSDEESLKIDREVAETEGEATFEFGENVKAKAKK
jgi:hypothetical protein